MTRNIRKGLLLAAAVGFLAVAPLVILYSVGFRPAGRTGVLIIESTPRRANVTVDTRQLGRTPQAVSDVGTRPVTVTVSLDGYTDWQKTVSVQPARANEFRSIRLFPNEISQEIIASDVKSFSLSPSRDLIAQVSSSKQFQIYDVDGQVVTNAIPLPEIPISMLWSPNNTAVLIEYDDQTLDLFTLPDETLTSLPFTGVDTRSRAAWDPRIPGRFLVLRANNALVAFDVVSKTQTTLATNVAAFAPASRNIYAVTPNGELLTFNLLGEVQKREPITLTKPVDQLLVSPSGFVAVKFTDQSLSVVDDDMTLRPISEHVEQAGFSPDGLLLYLQTAHNELAVYNIDNERLPHIPVGQVHLITRLSETISHPQWFAGGAHVIYQVEDRIIITEIDTRDHAISRTIDSTNTGNAQVAVGAKGDSLLYLKRTGTTTNLVRTNLLVEE